MTVNPAAGGYLASSRSPNVTEIKPKAQESNLARQINLESEPKLGSYFSIQVSLAS